MGFSMRNIFYPKMNCFLVVYDLNSPEPYEMIADYLRGINSNGKKEIVIFIVGNKKDLEKKVDPKKIENFGIKNFEVTSKGQN